MIVHDPPFERGDLACDVLVIGAGPAGSSSAISAASAGADVIMVDRRPRIGKPARCAGLVPAAAGHFMGHGDSVWRQPINMVRSFFPDGTETILRAPGFIIDRAEFDVNLSERAESAGARLLTGCRARPSGNGAVCRNTAGEELRIRARVVIGADGPFSMTGKLIGIVHQEIIVACQATMDSEERSQEARIFFDSRFEGGYAWLFPAGGEKRLGVGVKRGSGINPRQALEYFSEKMSSEGYVSGSVSALSGGPLPSGGIQGCHQSNIILAGDAAGLCNPQTGAGILSALISGELAGVAAAAAASGAGDSALAAYADEIEELFGDAIGHSGAARRWMSSRWNKDSQSLSRDLRTAWPLSGAFRKDLQKEVKISRA